MICRYLSKNGRCGLKGCYAYKHGCYGEDMCKCIEPITNGDRIRAMSNEELATFLKEVIKRARICQTARIDDSELCSLDWLHQPADDMSARGHENIGEVSQ